MQFKDFAGSTSIDLKHLHEFLGTWFRPDDLLTIVGIPATGVRKVMSFTVKASELVTVPPEEFEKLTVVSTDRRKINVYTCINPTKEENHVQLYSRGTKEDVRDVYGCFIDLDVVKEGKKQGVFETKQDIYAFLDSLEVPPTMVLDNGADGGIHAYWRLVDQDIPNATEELMARWWAYISSLSPVKIDRLIDKTRLSRLPSAIYWPSGDGKFDTVKVVKSRGPQYTLQELVDVSQDAFDKHNKRVSELRMQKTRIDVDLWNERLAQRISESEPDRRFSEQQVKIMMHLIDQYINTQFDWADILEPHGWTFLKESGEGDQVWARPGKNDRSATVNHQKNDGSISGVMSLLSSSDETRLADLKEAGVPLTKRQVLLRLKYNDDVIRMVDDMYQEVLNAQAIHA